MIGGTAVVLVASTRAARGVYEDHSGATLVDWLRSAGFSTPDPIVVEDAHFAEAFETAVADERARPRLIITSGGTGLSSDDRTVEAVAPHLDYEIPGVMYALWRKGLESTPTAVLSRGVAGVIGRSLVVTLPGSPGGVKDGIAVLDGIYPHVLNQLEDRHDH
ncbi:MogA/MoaB family molybdenum cofactor biosynthesis protein [Rothia uropygialis]|uniref:MogA/MoaB family molybdenum cofactor biosynthesis protein n=1 Tax=Kocuria sp. 36 TaxID=1415402 RepID=UPI00101C9FBC|nr:MogA/MoaB family molybdenum cofactor biosynthesis protein [Kocuria sp. 36]